MQIAYCMEMHVMGYNSYTIALLGITKVRIRIQVQVPVSLAGPGNEWLLGHDMAVAVHTVVSF